MLGTSEHCLVWSLEVVETYWSIEKVFNGEVAGFPIEVIASSHHAVVWQKDFGCFCLSFSCCKPFMLHYNSGKKALAMSLGLFPYAGEKKDVHFLLQHQSWPFSSSLKSIFAQHWFSACLIELQTFTTRTALWRFPATGPAICLMSTSWCFPVRQGWLVASAAVGTAPCKACNTWAAPQTLRSIIGPEGNGNQFESIIPNMDWWAFEVTCFTKTGICIRVVGDCWFGRRGWSMCMEIVTEEGERYAW